MGCRWLIYPGNAIELVGLAVVAWQLIQLQRREFGRPKFVQRLVDGYRRLVARLRRREDQTVQVSGTASLSASGSLDAAVTAPPVILEDRVFFLQRQVQDLQREQQASRTEFDGRINRLAGTVTEARTEAATAIQQQEASRREQLKESLRTQGLGTACFFVGVLLSAAGNAWPC